MPRYRVLIVDDHAVVREGLGAILNLEHDIEVVGGAGTVAESVALAKTLPPDIVIMDVRLAHGSGVDACREIKAVVPDAKVLMLTSYGDEEIVLSALAAGASGYLLKNTGKTMLLSALRAVGSGEGLLDPAVTRQVIERVQRGGNVQDGSETLSDRELQVLGLVVKGMTNKEIAERLFLSDHTVRNHVSRILQKLGLSRRSEAVAYAMRNRLEGLEPSPHEGMSHDSRRA